MDKNLNIGLILVDINKTDMQLFLCLNLLYRANTTNSKKAYKIREISNLSGLTSIAVVKSLNNLSNKNIIGKQVYEEGLVDRKVVQDFDPLFKKSLKGSRKPIKFAVERVGFYIVDDNVVYILNPIVECWKYPSKRKIGKTLMALDTTFFDNKFIKDLIANQKNGKTITDGNVNGWSIKSTLILFCDKYRVNYKAIYSVDWAKDYRIVKHLLEHLKTNNVPNDRLENFLDYAFATAKKAKGRNLLVNIANLKYYSNQYITNVIQNLPKHSEYERDEQGRLRKKTNEKTS